MNELKEQIYDFCKRGAVSFAEIQDRFGKGDMGLSFGKYEHLWYWQGLTQETVEALIELGNEKKILLYPTTYLVYLCDGAIPVMPIAKQVKDYKIDHWVPVVIWRTENIRRQLKPKDRKLYKNAGYDV